MKKKVVIGSTLSYIFIFINTIALILISPYIISVVGQENYGVYKIISSYIAPFAILDFGMGQTIIRFVSKFKAENNDEMLEKVVSHSIIILLIVCIIIGIVSIIGKFAFVSIYAKSLSFDELNIASKIYDVAVLQLLFIVIDNVIVGLIAGTEGYVTVNVIRIITTLSKYAAEYYLVGVYNAIIFVAICEAVSIALRLVIELFYLKRRSIVHFKWKRIDKNLINMLWSYTGLMFLDSIVSQLDNNVDNLVIGAVLGSSSVAVYSFGLQIFHMFSQISMSIATVMLPVMIGLVVNSNDSNERDVQEAIVKSGRVQFILLGAIDMGFFLFGKEFISLWLGTGYEDVWIITMLLILAGTIPYSLNVTVSVLRAKNYMVFRTVNLFISAMLNTILTFFMVKHWGYVYAAVSTAIVYVLVNTIVMNIYYRIRLGYHMGELILRIVSKPMICLLLTGGFSWIVLTKIPYGWSYLFIKVGCFGLIYIMFVLFFVYKGRRVSLY